MLILTDDETFAVNRSCIQSMAVTYIPEENNFYVLAMLTNGTDTHMAGPFKTREDAMDSLKYYVAAVNADPWD